MLMKIRKNLLATMSVETKNIEYVTLRSRQFDEINKFSNNFTEDPQHTRNQASWNETSLEDL